MAVTMRPVDTIHGALGECYITIDGIRYNFMQITEFNAPFALNLSNVPILGRIQMGKKAAGGAGTWTATLYRNQSVIRQYIKRYMDTGVMVPFEIQISTEDPSSAAGRETIIFKDCLFDEVTFATLSVSNELLTEDISGTYDSIEAPETFAPLAGFTT